MNSWGTTSKLIGSSEREAHSEGANFCKRSSAEQRVGSLYSLQTLVWTLLLLVGSAFQRHGHWQGRRARLKFESTDCGNYFGPYVMLENIP